jgi:hypothetical protein
MKERLIRIYETSIALIVAIAFAWCIGLAIKQGNKKDPVNPRKWAIIDTTYYGDSIYISTLHIDKVVLDTTLPEPHDPNDE